MKPIIQVVPKLPPSINGLGDYALNLAQQMLHDWGIDTQFIVCDPNWLGKSHVSGFAVEKLRVKSSNQISSLLSGNSVQELILHYVGYAYNPRGNPNWLVDGIEKWRTSCEHNRLVTMFHEIYAVSNRPWTSSFWLRNAQKSLASRLVNISDRCMTSRSEYADMLTLMSKKKEVEVVILPVFSNVGEPHDLLPITERTNRLILFGNRNNKARIYQNYQDDLLQICHRLGIDHICDLGQSTGLNLQNIKVKEMGILPARSISTLLEDSVVALLHYPPASELAKSSIFAAYCAHGLATFTTTFSNLPLDGLVAGKHYYPISARYQDITYDNISNIAKNGIDWYRTHDLQYQAQIYKSILQDLVEDLNNRL